MVTITIPHNDLELIDKKRLEYRETRSSFILKSCLIRLGEIKQ